MQPVVNFDHLFTLSSFHESVHVGLAYQQQSSETHEYSQFVQARVVTVTSEQHQNITHLPSPHHLWSAAHTALTSTQDKINAK